MAERRRARELADRLVRASAAAGDSGAFRHLVSAPWDSSVVFRSPDDSTALLEFVAGRWGQPSTVFTLVGERVSGYVLPSMDSIGPRVERYVALLQNGDQATELGRALRQSLLDSALRDLPSQVRRVVIVADDVLHRLPFDVLPLDDGQPLITRYAMGLAPSAVITMALRGRAARPSTGSTLILGNPEFDPGTERAETTGESDYRSAFDATGGLPPLPYAGREARSVGRFTLAPVIRLGREASESYFKHYPLEQVGILHLATHALVDDWEAEHTALALSGGDGEDGFLSPAEILQLQIGADLIVLSACRTAGGPVVRGEGVQGLSAPLIAAGARSVVATRWPIRDRATLRFVDYFYRSLASGQPVIEALRAAKLAGLRDGAPVSEWAPFVVVGDPLVQPGMDASRPLGRWIWGALLGGLAVAAGLQYVADGFGGWPRPRAENSPPDFGIPPHRRSAP